MYHHFFSDLNWEQDNLALRKRASQSSSHTPANGAGNAVDNFIVKNSASVTAVEMHAWWQVDLEAKYVIREVVITNAPRCMGMFC